MDEQTQMESSYSGKSTSRKTEITYKISLTAMLTAFAFILGGLGSIVGIFDPWTNGGSVSLSSLPLVFIGVVCGWQYGLLGGLVYAALDMVMDNGYAYSVNPVWISILLDYILGFGFAFVAGFFRKPFLRHKWWPFFVAMTLTMLLRFLSSFLSGVFAFATIADWSSPAVWIYSLTYNSGYIGISLVLDLIVGGLLIKPVWSMVDKTPLGLSL